MQFTALKSFTAAAQCRSFTKAAHSLGITQSAVSQQIATLERDLGIPLFDRVGRRVVLTEQGQRLLDYAHRILALVEEAQREVGGGVTKVQGPLRIASSTIPAESVLPDILAAFREQFPDVFEQITISDSRDALQAVSQGDVEVAFVGEQPHQAGLSVEPIGTDELLLVASPAHSLAKQGSLTVKGLLSESVIVRERGSGSRHCVEQALHAHDVFPDDLTIVMEANSNEAIRAAVERGAGVAFLSRHIVSDSLAAGRLQQIRVRGLDTVRTLYLVTATDRAPSLAMRAFLDFIAARE